MNVSIFFQVHTMILASTRPSVPLPLPAALPRPDSSIVVRFGKRLRMLRLEKGYTQTQLADYLGIDRSFISDVELGKKALSLSYLETIAQGFHLSISELTEGL